MIFKIEKCPRCKYQRWQSSPSTPGMCPHCGTEMRYSVNWYFCFYHLGRKYVQAGAPQKRITEDALAKKRVEIREKRFFDKAPEISWADAIKVFLEWARTNKAKGTYRMYKNSIDLLTPTFRRFALSDIRPEDVEQYKAGRLGKVSNATINRDIATLKRLCSLAVEWGELEIDRVKDVPLLKEPKGRVRFLTEDEIDKLLAECKLPYLRMAVVIALETGLRKEGCFTLKWSEIENGTVVKVVKGAKVVRIPTTGRLTDELSAYKAGLSAISSYIIPSPTNLREHIGVTAHKGFDAACKRAKITNFRFHDLRHTFASHFLMRGGDLKTLQEILGHSDLQTTMKYVHLLDQHKREQMDKFDKGRKKT